MLRRVITRIIETYRAAFRGLSREVWILSLIALVNRCGTMVVLFLVPYVREEFGYSPSEAGTLLAIYGLGSVTGIWLGGLLVDRLGYRTIILFSQIATGLVLFSLGLLKDPWALAVGAATLGVVSESMRPAMAVAITVHSTELTRPRAFGLLRLCVNLGMTVGPAAGGFIAEFDYAWLFRVDGTSCILASLVLLRLLPKSEASNPSPKSKQAAGRSPWLDKIFTTAMLLTLVQAFIFFQLLGTFTLYVLEERGFSKPEFGGLMAVNTIVIVLFEMVLVHAIERRNPLKVVAVAGLLIGLGFGLIPYATSVAALIGTVLLWTLGEMLAAPMMQTWVANRAPEHSRGRYLAGFSMVFSVASVIAPWAGTHLYEFAGPDWVWHACLAIGVAQIGGFWWLARKECRD